MKRNRLSPDINIEKKSWKSREEKVVETEMIN